MELNYYDILRTERDATTGTITAQLGDAVSGQRIVDDAEVWQQVGFASRPSNVLNNPDDSAQAVSISRTDGDVVFATRDIRGQEIYGNLSPGDTCIYASGPEGDGQARIYLKGEDSSINIFTRANADADGMGIFIDAQNDTIRITNASGNGILIDGDGVKVFTSQSLIEVGSGIKIGAGGNLTMDGGNVSIGNQAAQLSLNATNKISLGGQAALLPAVTQVTGGSGAPAVGVPSSKVFLV